MIRTSPGPRITANPPSPSAHPPLAPSLSASGPVAVSQLPLIRPAGGPSGPICMTWTGTAACLGRPLGPSHQNAITSVETELGTDLSPSHRRRDVTGRKPWSTRPRSTGIQLELQVPPRARVTGMTQGADHSHTSMSHHHGMPHPARTNARTHARTHTHTRTHKHTRS